MTFDRVIVVDWSARSAPSPARPSADAIWLCVHDGEDGGGEPEYHRTRAAAMARVAALLDHPGRILLGFDFGFGFPRGLARRLTGRDAGLDLWDWLADRIEDGPDNRNNRFEVAARINAAFPGVGPLWGRPAGLDLPDLPARGRARRGHGLTDRRAVDERVRTAQPVVKLYTTGSVGSQTLLGLPRLARLRRDRPDLRVWPQETGFAVPDARIVLAEIYPSLFAPADHPIRDAGQVVATAAALRAAPEAWFTAPATIDDADRVAAEEGWILGVGPDGPLPAPRAADDCFALPPGIHWTPVETAWDTLSRLTPTAGIETIDVGAAAGRILAADVAALRPNPPRANAAVDGWGYAHAALSDAPADGPIPIAPGRAAAGRPHPDPVPPGAALRILTGAVLPDGVDTVALQEDATVLDGALRLPRRPKAGANTRAAGEDVAAGRTILRAGQDLRPGDLAIAIAAGHATLGVRRRLRVAVLSTGDEIVPPGGPVDGVPDANRPMLLAMLAAWGMSPVDRGHVADDPDRLAAALDAAAEADAVLTSGGASAGDEDHMSRLLAARGTVAHWRIAVKPGRPLMLGRWRGTPLFGLPGNPVAAFTCAALFARPALRRMAGAPWSQPRRLRVPAAFAKRKNAGRREYLRARLDADGAAEVFASEGSGRVSGLSWAEGFVELPDAALEVRPGDAVAYIPFAEIGLG